ncbi:MAG: outer membrane protein assembly factor BamB family protein [Planctomycetota bacterium]
MNRMTKSHRVAQPAVISKKTVPSVLLLIAILATHSRADWPQYRSDATRSGYTSESLPGELSVKWVRHARHAPERAWVGRSLARSRMKFDWAYSVVVADGACYFGSSADHKIYAVDAATGRQKWSFFTGGPVRLAPAVWQDKVFAASDDGYLYCLAARDGTLLWKLRAGPDDDLVLGNGRMVSRWVARGGPAVRDGVVYFGAGIWPADGACIYAVDAQSGKILWCNDDAAALEIDQPHMGAYSRAGVAAQGYLAVTNDKVFVMTGRSVPTAFDRKTGRFLYFHLSRYGGKTPWGVGGGDVAATDEVFFTAGFAFDTATGMRHHQVGKRNWWVPFVRDGHKFHGEFLVGERQVIACTPDGFVRSEGKTIYGSVLAARTYETRREFETSIHTPRLTSVGPANKGYMERIENAPSLKDEWSVETGGEIQELIVAGKTIAIGSGSRVSLIDAGSGKMTCSLELDDTVYAMAASNGCLYASTGKGTIYCLSDEAAADVPAGTRPQLVDSPYSADGPAGKVAGQIIRKTGITRGYCLDLGCGDGALAYELAKRTDLYVVAVDADPANVTQARRRLDAAGLYGTRVVVLRRNPSDTHLPDYFANLIVSSASLFEGIDISASAEIARLQRPYGGVVCLGKPEAMTIDVRSELEGAGSWTHPLGDPGNTICSGDKIAKGPLGTLWYRDETLETIDRHGKNPSPLFYEGVLLRQGTNAVQGVDAYNGHVIWQKSIRGLLDAYLGGSGVGATQIGNTYCAADDVIYIRHLSHCLILDVRSGRELGRFEAPRHPDGRKRDWSYIACEDGILYGSLANETHTVKSQHGSGNERTQVPMDRHFTESSLLFAMDSKTGDVKWTWRPGYSIRNNSIAVANGRIHFIDRPVAQIDRILRETAEKKRRGGEPLPAHPLGRLLALDGRTGDLLWEKSENVYGTTLIAGAKYDALLMCYNHVGRAIPSDGFNQGTTCFRASDGKVLWETSQKLGQQRPIVIDRTSYSLPGAWDLLTGEPKMVTRNGREVPWELNDRRTGCGPLAGSQNLLMGRAASIGYYDLTYDPGQFEYFGGARAGCWINMLAVGGIVLVPDDSRACRCAYQNQATLALIEHGVRPPQVTAGTGQDNYRHDLQKRSHTFVGNLKIVMSHPREDVQIRYTLDDTYPTHRSPLYTEPITLERTTAVRATAFRGDRKLAVRDATIFTRVDELQTKKQKRRK